MISYKLAASLGDIEDAYKKLSGEAGAVIRISGSLRYGGGSGN